MESKSGETVLTPAFEQTPSSDTPASEQVVIEQQPMSDETQTHHVEEALIGVSNNMTFMLGGFGLCGIPENAIAELVKRGVKNVTCISPSIISIYRFVSTNIF